MQLPGEDAAGGAPALPPQATGGLPGMAADLGDIAPAPPAAQVLQTAALGDRGSAQADALRAAGQPPMVAAPTPAAATSPAMQPTAPEMAPEGSPLDLAAAALASPQEWRNIQATRQMRFQQTLALQEEYRRNAAEFYSTMFDVAAKNFPGRPDLAAVFLQNQAAQRGLHLDPSVAAQLRQAIIDGQITGKQLGDVMENPSTPISTIQRFGTSLKMLDDLRKGRAEAERAETVSAAAGPQQALEIAQKVRGLQRPLTKDELTTLHAGGMAAYQVQVPGAPPGTWMWMPGPENRVPDQTNANPPTGQPGHDPNVAPPASTPPRTAPPVGVLRGPDVVRAHIEAKQLAPTQQRLVSQIATALGPIDKLDTMMKDPAFKDAIATMGPQYTITNPITGSVRAMPFTSDREGTSHDSIEHPLNVNWYNYKQGGLTMTPQERQLFQQLGMISASGWQGLTSGIRNRAVIEDVKAHIPRPWDTPEMVADKIAGLREWYKRIKEGAVEGSETLAELAKEDGGNPFPIVLPARSATQPATTPPASAQTPPASGLSAADAYVQSLKGSAPAAP